MDNIQQTMMRTIGSCGIGLGPIFTLVSAATPPAFIDHAVWLLLIQEMYCTGDKYIVNGWRNGARED